MQLSALHSNAARFELAETARLRSEQLRNEAVRLVEDRHIRTQRTQSEASNKEPNIHFDVELLIRGSALLTASHS